MKESPIYRNWMELITPTKLEIRKDPLNPNHSKIICEPLERGFGVTIGNSLRRIMLASLQGAAIVSVKIENVLHELSSIPGVLEDVSGIILNLKGVRLRLFKDHEADIYVEKNGEGVITAGDFVAPTGEVEVLNPEHHIATLGPEGELRMEMKVKWGKGYSPSEKNKEPDQPVNDIPIDAIFSPVLYVNYQVSQARVGQVTDYDKLTMDILTDGSLLPDEALAYAAKILKEQMKIYISFDEEVHKAQEPEEEAKPDIRELLNITIDELNLSVRAANCLKNADINYVGDILRNKEQDLLKIKNFGRKSLDEIKQVLDGMGLHLEMPLDDWTSPETLEAESEAS